MKTHRISNNFLREHAEQSLREVAHLADVSRSTIARLYQSRGVPRTRLSPPGRAAYKRPPRGWLVARLHLPQRAIAQEADVAQKTVSDWLRYYHLCGRRREHVVGRPEPTGDCDTCPLRTECEASEGPLPCEVAV